MARIFLPTMAAFREDVEIMMGLLEKTVGTSEHEFGLEVIGKHSHFVGAEAAENLGKIQENLMQIARGAHLSVHGFSGIDCYETGSADMRTENGLNLLQTYLRLAQDIRAGYVHIHSAAGYRGDNLSLAEKRRALTQIKQNMLLAQEQSRATCKIGIENPPCPSMGDVETNPEQIWRDHVESLEDCLDIVRETDLKVTLDTCHYACGKKGEINLINAAQDLGNYLTHFHISDVQGVWVPSSARKGGSVWTEGIIPGKGRIGERAFADFFKHVAVSYPNGGICVEVVNKDFKNPIESEESIKRVLNWLK
ncbi:MAG: TIM barrel protein [Candidatus Woesearchaeota archaeon]